MAGSDMAETKLKQISCYVEHELAERLQAIAKEDRRTLSNLMAIVLEEYAEKREREKKT